MADDINLPNLVSHLGVNLDGVSGAISDAARQGSAMGSALGQGINRQLDDLLRHLPQVTIDGNSDPLDRDLARVHRSLALLDSQRIGVDVSVGDALRQLEDLETNLQRIGDQHPDINVRAATAQAARQLEELRAAARRVDDTDVEIDVDVDEDGPNRLTGILRRIPAVAAPAARGLAGVGTAAAGIGAAVPLAAGLVTTLASVAPAAGVAVTGMAALQLAQGAVKLAAVGMEDALTAALDPSKAEEFGEALKKLSPEARKFALAVKDAAPALRRVQRDVQDHVFKGLADELERTGKSVLPVLRKNLLSSGDALNKMAKGASGAARELADNGTLGKALGSASKGLHNLSGVPGIVVKSLGQIAAAAGPSFERLTKSAATAMGGLGDRLDRAFESGAMEDAIEGAIDLLRDLMEVGENVGEIIGGIFKAVPEGGGIVGVLQTVTEEIAEAVNSPEVQEGLTALFEVMNTLAETAAPLLGDALRLLAPVLAELGPPVQELITSLGEGLQPIIDELGRSGLLRELAVALGEVLIAVAPLLEPLGELVAAILPYLVPLVQRFADGVRVLAEFIERFVVPALQIVTDLLRGDFSSAMQGAKDLSKEMVAETVLSFAGLPSRAGTAVSSLKTTLGQQVGSAGVTMVTTIRDAMTSSIGSLATLPGRASTAISSLKTTLGQQAAAAALTLLRTIREGVGQTLLSLSRLPSQVAGAVGDLGMVLFRAGVSVIAGFIRGIRSMIPSVHEVLGSITSMIPRLKGPPAKDAKILTPAGRLVIEGFIRGINDTTPKLRSRLASITKALPSNVRSGIGRTLRAATNELSRLIGQRDSVLKKLAAGQKKLDELVKARNKAASDITEGILKEANITTGHADVHSVSAITVGLQQALKRTQEFQKNITALRKAGLRADLLQQIADAGVSGGAATAAALARATPAELRRINDLQAQLTKSASSTGATVGDALYQAGIRAAQGLIAGLRSQEGAIERQMVRVAKGMITTTKKAHKTRSPSRVFRWIGEMDGRGLEAGLLATVGRVRAAARTVAGAALDVASGVGGALAVTPTAGQLAAVTAGTVSGSGDQYNTIHLYGSEATPDEMVRALSWRGLVGRR